MKNQTEDPIPGRFDVVRLHRLGSRGMPICVARSAMSATLAYSLALSLQLQQPLWAPVSALITARESWGDTFAECRSRILGTAVGTALAILGHLVLSPLDFSPVLDLAIVTGVAAAIVAYRPDWRVGLWTAAITLLSQVPGMGIWETGFARFSEVALGSVVATGIAGLEFRLRRYRFASGRESVCGRNS